jgi:predicted permease
MKLFHSISQRIHIQRPQALIFALAAVLAVLVLAAGLSGLELMPGEPEAFGFVFRSTRAPPQEFRPDDRILNVIRIVYLVGLVLLPIWLIYIIVNPQARKRFIRDMITFGTFIFMFLMLASYFSERMQEQEGEQFGNFGGFPEAPLGEGADRNFGNEPPESLMWVASVLVALVVVGFVALVFWIVWRSRRKKDKTLERIAGEVQTALDDLQSGGDLRNVIIRCYNDMVTALREMRGVHRNSALTPREFEDILHSMGFPMEPVHQLTRLFETVRYGHKSVTRREELIAQDSLMAILDACRIKG